MAENKLPNGVGKKIVQALKKQAEIEIQPIPDNIEQEKINLSPEFYSQEITDNVSLDDGFSDFSFEESASEQMSDFSDSIQNLGVESESEFEEDFNNNSQMFENDEIFTAPQPKIKPVSQQKSYSMPANVAVLKRLIMQLPQGVTKQTGAQIIRQTMEALGISMKSVLQEAQQGQDSLTASARSCMTTIQEYRNNIKSLEKQVQDYKKQAIALNDLISLFIMTDKH